MDRFKILTDAEAFKKAFPNKAEFVVSESIVELLTLYLEIRTDFDYLTIFRRELLHPVFCIFIL